MRHNDIRYRLPEFIEGRLSAAENTIVREHLGTCEECKAELKSFERIHDALTRAEAPTPDHYWVTLLPRIHRRIEERRGQPVSGWPKWVFRYAVPFASAALLLVLLFRIISPDRGSVLKEDSANKGSASLPLGVREVLQGADSVEVQQIEDRSVFLPFEGVSEVINGENRFSGDKEVLKTILTNSNDLYTAIEIDLQTAQEDLNDQEVNDILSQLKQRKFIN